jgi:hypothetical protein
VAKKQNLLTGEDVDKEVIKNVERLEMKDEIIMLEKTRYLLPQTGTCMTTYKTVYLVHKIIISFYLPIVIAFNVTPGIKMVIFDSYLDLIFLIEIICTFFTAYNFGKNMKLITSKKQIARNYICSTFFLDVLACIPYSGLHLRSQAWPEEGALIVLIVQLNFNALPFFYRMIICLKFVRMNHIRDYWDFCLKKVVKSS